VSGHPPPRLDRTLIAVLALVGRMDLAERATISKAIGRTVVPELTTLHRQGFVREQLSRRPDSKRTRLYSVTTKGAHALAEAGEATALPILALGRPSETPEGVYDGAELKPFAGRPGAMDAQVLPSRMGDRRYWRDGRVETIG
jgi:hypothetical protein